MPSQVYGKVKGRIARRPNRQLQFVKKGLEREKSLGKDKFASLEGKTETNEPLHKASNPSSERYNELFFEFNIEKNSSKNNTRSSLIENY